MPDTDPLMSDDDAKQLFRLEAELRRTNNEWELLKEQTKEAKGEAEKARDALESFLRELSAGLPLFEKEDTAGEDVNITVEDLLVGVKS